MKSLVDPTVSSLALPAPFPWRGKGRGWGGGCPAEGTLRHTERNRVSAAHQNPRASTPSQPFPLEGKGFGV
ncbi:MAG: hypothetical protein ACI9YM_001008 [Brevundimonas sp.]|jgi:hypothetical protein